MKLKFRQQRIIQQERLVANKFNVSYQQVYTWVKKYNKDGYNALVDRRGKNKLFEELSESEKLSAQLKLLEAENRRLKMENDFLKKLEEIERRQINTLFQLKISILLLKNYMNQVIQYLSYVNVLILDVLLIISG